MPALDPVSAVSGAVEKALGIVDQFVVDKDERARISADLIKYEREMALAIIKTKTSPFVDATVKFMYAFADVGLKLFRPVVGALATGFAAYASAKGIDIPEPVLYALAAMFPGWMAAREVGKSRDASTEVERERISAIRNGPRPVPGRPAPPAKPPRTPSFIDIEGG